MKKALISFVGTNDKGIDSKGNKSDGAIMTVLKERKYDFLHLIYNPTKSGSMNFYDIAINIRDNAVKRKHFNKTNIVLHSFECENVTDHNEIYPKLLNLCKSLPKNIEYTAAIASGTPTMQVCWILMAESGDFKIKLIRSNEPRFEIPLVTEVKLGTGLPRIKKLENEKRNILREIRRKLLPVNLEIDKISIRIDNQILPLSHIEFCYYLYFLKRAYYKKHFLKVPNNNPGEEFVNSINSYYTNYFPSLDRNKTTGTSFHSNVSKINKKIKDLLGDTIEAKYYMIQGDGLRGNKSYSINLDPRLIRIK